MHARFGDLRANSILARLQLAALCAATSSLLQDPHSSMSGAEMAMELVRQCWCNRPLTEEESSQLSSVGRLGGHLSAGLRLLVHELHTSAGQLGFLYSSALEGSSAPALESDAASCYMQDIEQMHATGLRNSRLTLTVGEEERVLSWRPSFGISPPAWLRQGLYSEIEVPPFPVNASIITDTENKLSSFVQRGVLSNVARPYPLCIQSVSEEVTPLEQEMHAELRSSWEAHCATSAPVSVNPSAQAFVVSSQVWCLETCLIIMLTAYGHALQ